MAYTEIEGDLIELAKSGRYDVITHGCNCFCTMGAGIAPQMAKAFGADKFPLEAPQHRGKIDKLGMINYQLVDIGSKKLIVVNSYTQYSTGPFGPNGIPLDYEALTLCLRKINMKFPGKRIGLPQIGCGLAGGYWSLVQPIIEKELCDMNVEVVIYNK